MNVYTHTYMYRVNPWGASCRRASVHKRYICIHISISIYASRSRSIPKCTHTHIYMCV